MVLVVGEVEVPVVGEVEVLVIGEVEVPVVGSVVATVVVNCCVTAGVTLDVVFGAMQPNKADKRSTKIRSMLRKAAARPLKNCFKNFFILISMLFALSTDPNRTHISDYTHN